MRPLPSQVDDIRCEVERALWLDAARAFLPGRRPVRDANDPGKRHEAALLETRDGGRTFAPLPWRATWRSRSLTAVGDWPPERLDAARLEDGRLVIEWEDPWSAWELGSAWRATWDPAPRAWRVEWRSSDYGETAGEALGPLWGALAACCLPFALAALGAGLRLLL